MAVNVVSRMQRIQLVAVLVIAVLGIVYVGARYARLDVLLLDSSTTVIAELEDSGGIFVNAEVTYRGIPVGRVGALSLTDTGVDVELLLDRTAPDVPADTRAVVANRSAIGEQYVDLQPRSNSAPFLTDGSRIGRADTGVPTPVEDVFANVHALAQDVPVEDLRTVVTELGAGFDGTGDDLRTLVDSLDGLTRDGLETLPQTVDLIRESRVVLDTQGAQASSITQFSRDLDQVTAQLRASDPDVRRLVDTGSAASSEVGAFTARSSAAVTSNLSALAGVSAALSPRTWALRPLLFLLPTLAMGARSVTPGDTTIHLGLVGEVNNPPACTQGYEGTQRILDRERALDPDFDDTARDFPINLDANCTTEQGSVTGVRSANRAVFADPAQPQPWDSAPKTAPDPLDLNPIATQLAPLLGVTVR